jgi:hypothetical protein
MTHLRHQVGAPAANFHDISAGLSYGIHRFTGPSRSGSEAAFANAENTIILKRGRTIMKRKSKLSITAMLFIISGTVVYAQEKYSLASPDGVAFSDFKGYEDWSVVSSARTDEVLKVIVANPIMIDAYKAGFPGNGQPFPDGSKIAKLQWKPKKSTEAPFAVDVPDFFTQAFVMEKDSKRFPKSGGWGYALFNYEAASDKFTADPSPSDCGHSCHVAVKAKDHIFHPYQKR